MRRREDDAGDGAARAEQLVTVAHRGTSSGEASVTSHRPLAVVIAGPHGAGKSTAAPFLLQGALAVQEFVNADTIATGLSAFHPQAAAMSAGRVMLERLAALARMRADLAFETTLASRSFAAWLKHLRESGYRTHLAFLSLPSAELAVSRVAERVRAGGHDVAEDVVRRRFRAGLMFDNSGLGLPSLIASREGVAPALIVDAVRWAHLVELGKT